MSFINTFSCFVLLGFYSLACAQSPPQSPAPSNPVNLLEPTPPKVTVSSSPYTYHFHPKPTHKHVTSVSIEREHTDTKVDGVAYFTNSFGQPSIYVYPWGRAYHSILGVDKLSFIWTGGVIYGYKGEFKDQVENYKGFAPAAIFSLAYQVTPRWSTRVNLIGLAAMQFQIDLALK